MDAKTRRKMYREEVRKSQEDSHARKDDSGKFKTIFKDIPGGLWKCKEGEHSINIIPFIAGPNHPTKKEGKSTYILDVFVHTKVGSNEDSYICLNKSYGKECPICDYQTRLHKQDDFDEAEVKALYPTRRAVYNVQVLDTKEDKKTIRIFDVSHFLFEKELVERAENMKGGKVYFADPDEGKIIAFKRRGKGAKDTKYAPFDFEERESPISDEMLDGAYCLDMMINIPTQEEVSHAFFGVLEKEIHEETPSKRKPKEKASEKETEKETEKEPVADADVDEPSDCPYDFVFGVDVDTYDECADCGVNAGCLARFEEIQEEKEARRKAREAAKKKEEPAQGRSRRSSR